MEDAAKEPNRHLRLLLVEDDHLYVDIFKAMLKKSRVGPFLVDTVETLAEAHQGLKQEQYDIVVLDLLLPDARELEALHSLRNYTLDMPIVVLTGSEDESITTNALETGAQDYLIKGRESNEDIRRALWHAMERKKVEKKARETAIELERQKQVNALQSKFISLVSHEFRTPLAIIDTAIQLIQRKPEKESLEKEHKKIERATKRMLELLEKVLDLKRMESGDIKPNPTLFNLKHAVETAITDIKNTQPQRDVIADIAALPTQFFGDRELLQIICSNLLQNAAKYSPVETPITVTARELDDVITLEVIDQGKGMSPEICDHIFDKFYRSPDTSARVSGPGLGLFFVKEFTELHDGSVSFISAPGEGSTFRVTLPIKQVDTA